MHEIPIYGDFSIMISSLSDKPIKYDFSKSHRRVRYKLTTPYMRNSPA